jgi:hypothetical protein
VQEIDDLREKNERLLKLNAHLLGLIGQFGGKDKILAMQQEIFNQQKEFREMCQVIKRKEDEAKLFEELYRTELEKNK